MANDTAITQACAAGSLELNSFLPLIAANLLDSIDLLATGCDILHRHCVKDLQANPQRCRESVEYSTAILTALVSRLGYGECCRIEEEARKQNKTVRQITVDSGRLSKVEFEQLTSPATVCRLGFIRDLG